MAQKWKDKAGAYLKVDKEQLEGIEGLSFDDGIKEVEVLKRRAKILKEHLVKHNAKIKKHNEGLFGTIRFLACPSLDEMMMKIKEHEVVLDDRLAELNVWKNMNKKAGDYLKA